MKKEIYLDTTDIGTMDKKPPKDERPICLNCKKMIPMRSGRAWLSDFKWEERPKFWFYAGFSFFCHRECAAIYAWKAAKKELGIEDINSLK